MYYKIFNDKKEETKKVENEGETLKQLTLLLFNKYVVKCKYIKQVQYNYNYRDLQVVIFVFDNNYRQIFYNVPTQLGALDINRL